MKPSFNIKIWIRFIPYKIQTGIDLN